MTVKLKGKNQLRKFERIADRLVSKIVSHEGVAGIVFIGGLVRGFADHFSDVDITVFLSKKDERLKKQLRRMARAKQKGTDVDVDLEIHFLGDFKKRRWSEIDLWEYSKAKIVYDPEGETAEALEEKLRVPRDYWVRRLAACSEYLKWYACPPPEGVGTVAEAWVERGDLVSAHHCLNYAVELLMRIVFALNREFYPPPKWTVFYSRDLKWLPKGYHELLKEATLVKSFTVKDLNRRLRAIRRMWSCCTSRVEAETGLTLTQLSHYYVKKILNQV